MKICIFTHTFPRFPGDTSAPFMGELVEELAKKNEVIVLTPFEKEVRIKLKRPFKLITYKYIFPDSLHILGYSKTLSDDKKLSVLGFLISPFLYVFGFIALLRLVKKEKIDVVSSHWVVPGGFIASWVSLLTGIPYTTTIPGSDVYMGTKNILYRSLVNFGAMRANWVISDSKHYIEQLKSLGSKPKNVSIIRYGVNSSKFKPAKKDLTLLKKLGIDKNKLIVMGLGRFVAKKGFIYLVESAPVVMKKFKNVVYLLIGGGDQEDALKHQITELGMENKFILPGMIPFSDLPRYYNLADVFVMPSVKDEKGNIDASPVSMMEAMMCGVPTVATHYAGGKEVITNGKTGYVIAPKKPSEIAKSVISLLRKIEKEKNIKKIVREEAIINFSVTAAAQKYVEIFKKIITSY